MSRMDLVKERTGDIIDDLINRNNLSNAKLAEIMECSTNTIDQYRRRKHVPKSTFLHTLYDKFDVNMCWMYQGKGERYLGSGSGLLKQSGDESDDAPRDETLPGFWDDASVAEPAETYGAGKPWHERITGALTKLVWILELGSSWSRAMEINVDSLYRACKAERKKERTRKKLNRILEEQALLESC